MNIAVFTGLTETPTKLAWMVALKEDRKVVTMDEEWFEAAAELGRPRYFFKDKLTLMRFCLGHDVSLIAAKDRTDNTIAMVASMFAMGATIIEIGG